MRRRLEATKAITRLRIELQGWRLPSTTNRTVWFQPPPIYQDIRYGGARLKHVVVPTLNIELKTLGRLFDSMMLGRDWTDGVPSGHRKFINNDPVRLLTWASALEDTTLEVQPDAGVIMLIGEYTFGLADGKIYGLDFTADSSYDVKDLLSVKPASSRDGGFVTLYRRATKLGKQEAKQALEYIRAYKVGEWSNTMPWIWQKSTECDLSFIGELIHTSDDPVSELYIYLVPNFVSSEWFFRYICDPINRPAGADDQFKLALFKKIMFYLKE